ncbi:MAG: YifB family Mg chelatase-like AAA ATPase [Bacteroidales bacterium]|nr:YifB family Mg chelatase-like AAA ATPase [Candidatus Cacconaster merdequi]
MLNKTYCASCIGINAVTVTVEMDISPGIGIHLVGLPDSAVRESLLRVVTALTSYGFSIPGRKLVVNLAPADIRKEGSSYDLAIALGILAVSGQVKMPLCEDFIVVGELSLDGKVRPVPGSLPIACHAKDSGFKGCIFPQASAGEAADIDGIRIYGVETLSQAIDILCGLPEADTRLVRPGGRGVRTTTSLPDFKDVKGQTVARRGLEIAAAGGHSVLLSGPPGSGKSMMASCLPSILPPMTREESIVTSKLYSVAGYGCKGGLMTERPFRSPHQSISMASLIGGGPNATPGDISLAHNGVLYLDEVAQFGKSLIDSLRQPVEDGKVTISRVRYKVEYPCSFMLVASMNPCPCGYLGDGTGRCTCSRNAIERYRARISGPFLDRIDLQIFVSQVNADEMVRAGNAEPSSVIAGRVARAREMQLRRFSSEGIFTNSRMDASLIKKYCPLGQKESDFMEKVIRRLNLSARSYGRILKISRTIADLEGNDSVTLRDISEAVQFRALDRNDAEQL